MTLETRGLATRLPVASAAFMLGALGFIAFRRHSASSGIGGSTSPAPNSAGPLLIAAMCAASAMTLLCYARAIHRTWLGPTDIADTGRSLAPAGGAVLLVVAVASVAFGFMPDTLRVPSAAPPHALAALERSAP